MAASSRREGRLILGRCCCGPLLTATSCSAAQHCSTPRPLNGAAEHQSVARSTGRAARPCETTATQGGNSIYRWTREALREEPTRAQRALPGDQRPWWVRWEGQRESRSQVETLCPGTAPGILRPTSPLLHSHTLIGIYYLSLTPSRGRGTTSRGSRRGPRRRRPRRRRCPRSRRSRGRSCWCWRTRS